MRQNILIFVIIAIASTHLIVAVHIFKDYKNKELVLMSVYDAIKHNVQQDMQKKFNQNEMGSDSRNKRNTIAEKAEYYDVQPTGSE